MAKTNARILCVEDDRDSREMISTLLRGTSENYQVTAVATAAEALELAGKDRYDLFILDVWLPGMDGVELCRRLRESGIVEPIMFFSAMDVRAKNRDYFLNAGANEFLIKSVDIDRLTDTVSRLLDGKVR